ncbi:MAG: hypothetical protein KTR33_14560 [Gammaproteobacteria bacterium]|nr:hypothetical protein [Gammaproteobacteria bacterium]
MTGTGVLALWNDCAVGHEFEYERWYQTEHIDERLSVPGFNRCRRYEALDAATRFFTWYEVQTPEVLTSKAYLDRLGDPTPLTATIMSGAIQNMSRTVCHRHVLSGHRFGSVIVTATLHEADDAPAERVDDLREYSLNFTDEVSLARSELWISAEGTAATLTREESLRGGDAKIEACLVLEYLRQGPAEAGAKKVTAMLPAAQVGVYRLLCEQVDA